VTLAIYGIIGLCVVGALVGIFFFSGQSNVTPTRAPAPMASPAPAPTVDLSSMTPREAADQLFNRIMMADEQGNKEEVMRFAPMALQAYERVEFMDADAHFHLGLIHTAAGDYASASKEIGILKQYAPNHLLAMLLEHEAAMAAGDTNKAAAIEAAFNEAYPTEIVTNRPEYQGHLNSIEGFRARIGAN
jgi:tetratricopeptide (TPR) repeat protein